MRSARPAARWLGVVSVPLFLALTGCSREQIQVQEVPKEAARPSAAAQTASPHGTMGHGSLSGPELAWTLPEGWLDLGPASMSLANFAASNEVGEVTGSIVPLPGIAGRELDVINIFRERFGMAPLDSAGLAALTSTATIGPGEGQLFDMTTEGDATHSPARLLVAVLNQNASSYYVRITGAPAAVEAEKPAFLEFLKSLSLQTPTPTTAEPPPLLSRAGPGQGLPEWTVPDSWSMQAPPRMVLAKFVAGPENQTVDITVSAFPGDVGGAAANVHRWRSQIGLPALSDAEVVDLLEPVEMGDGQGQLVELTNPAEGSNIGMIGAIVPRGDRTWFYKMVGDNATVQAQKALFVEFLRGAKHPQ